MSRMLPRACAVVAVVAVLAPFSPASAEKWTARDGRGDVAGYTYTEAASEDECPTFTEFDAPDDSNDDITRVVVRHTRKLIVATVGFRDLDPALEQTVTVHVKTADRGWFVDVNRSEQRPGKFKTSLFIAREPKYPKADDIDPDPPVCGGFSFVSADKYCSGRRFSVDVDHDYVRVELPRACLHNPRWVSVGAGSSGFDDSEPPTDQQTVRTFTGYYDSWEPEGTTSTGWLPPFGPRIRVREGIVS